MSRQRRIANMSLSPEIYAEVNNMAQQKGISRSELLRQALKQYVASEKRWQQIREWGTETTQQLGIKNERDIERIVDEYREEGERGLSSR
jgi:metal-responsive CopG/Arc/MetJ family transcriptional regulator